MFHQSMDFVRALVTILRWSITSHIEIYPAFVIFIKLYPKSGNEVSHTVKAFVCDVISSKQPEWKHREAEAWKLEAFTSETTIRKKLRGYLAIGE